jgi:hypothetical protein
VILFYNIAFLKQILSNPDYFSCLKKDKIYLRAKQWEPSFRVATKPEIDLLCQRVSIANLRPHPDPPASSESMIWIILTIATV